MTLEQAKDKIAIEYEYSNWGAMTSHLFDESISTHMLISEIEKRYGEAAELYAASKAKEEAIAFNEWVKDNRWKPDFVQNNWYRTFSYQKPEIKTTAELFELFKKQS